MAVEIVYSPEALRDLDEIWEWIAFEHGEPNTAHHVISDMMDRIDQLSEHPLLSTPLNTVCTIQSDYRFVEKHGYLAFFRTDHDHLYVDRIRSGKSDYLRTLFGVKDGTPFYT